MSSRIVVIAGGGAVAVVIAIVLIVLLVMRDSPPATPDDESLKPDSTVPVLPTQEAAQPLPALPWQEDGLNDLEEVAARSLEAIREADPAIAQTLSALPWLADEMLLHELAVLGHIEEIAKADPALAQDVAALPWLAEEEGLSGSQLVLLAEVRELAVTDSALAGELAVAAWMSDDVTLTDVATLSVIRGVAQEDPELALRVAQDPGIADGISDAELAALTGSDNYFLELLERDHPGIAEIVRSYGWSSRGPGGNGKRSSGLLAHPLSRPAGQENQWNSTGLLYIRLIADIDAALGRKVALLPWVADGITELESTVLSNLAWLTDDDSVDLVDDLLSLEWVRDEHLTARDANIYSFLGNTYHTVRTIEDPNEDTGLVPLLFGQPWFRDGLSSEDRALLVALDAGCAYERFCRELIEGRPVVSRILPIPSGDVEVFVVSRSPLGTAGESFIFQETTIAIEAIEEIMGPPWINPGVVVYVEPEFQYISDHRGFYAPEFYDFGPGTGSHIMISGADPSSDDDKHVLHHELAHHYLRGPHWLTEGGAEFLAAYVLHAGPDGVSGYNSLQSQYDLISQQVSRDVSRLRVQGACSAPDIHAYNQGQGDEICGYRLGNRFLLALYLNLGHQMVSSSLQELDRLWRDGGWPGEEEIYQVLLSHTPPQLVDEFHALYEELHGRPVGDDSTPALAAPTPTSNPTPAPIPLGEAELAEEREALIALYNATGGPDWENNTNWLSDKPLWAWYGVGLDPQGSVESLALVENQLSGPIPPELGNLANLVGLVLYGNQLSGPIPPELSQLRRLGYLNLHSNQLSGPIPPELGNLTHLAELDLGFNQLSGLVPPELGSLANLTGLGLSGNQLTGPIPPELGNLANLTGLGLNGNQLTGPIPPELGNLANLVTLYLSENQLTGPIPPELGNVAYLHLDGNQFECVPSTLRGKMTYSPSLQELPICTATSDVPSTPTPAGTVRTTPTPRPQSDAELAKER